MANDAVVYPSAAVYHMHCCHTAYTSSSRGGAKAITRSPGSQFVHNYQEVEAHLRPSISWQALGCSTVTVIHQNHLPHIKSFMTSFIFYQAQGCVQHIASRHHVKFSSIKLQLLSTNGKVDVKALVVRTRDHACNCSDLLFHHQE